MTRNVFIANRLREVFLSGHWIANTNYQEQLRSVSWKQATLKVGNLNTIALLTFHINYYLNGLLNVFNGGRLEISDKYSFDMPPIQNEDGWQKLLGELLSNAASFSDKVERMPDEKFDEIFVDEKYGSYWRNIEAILEHSYYHLGQISLVKKMVLELEEREIEKTTT
jgi:hypothetical protein